MSDPGAFQLLLQRAIAAHQSGRLEEAREIYRELLGKSPDLPEAVHFLGLLEMQTGKAERGIALLERSIRLAPSVGFFHSNLGEYYRRRKLLGQAAECFRRAIQIDPHLPAAHANLGNVLKSRGDVAGAIAAFRNALELDPTLAVAHSNLLLLMHYDPAVGTRHLFEEHVRWARMHGKKCAAAELISARVANDRLRIAYLSPDLGMHPVGMFMEPILQHHDHRRFDISCYSDLPQPDAVTHRLRSLADHWRDTALLSDRDLAEVIRRDAIDILIDLAGHTSGNRLPMLSSRLAPLQVTYLGYPDTTGLAAMDYRITDSVLNPPSQHELEETLHTEKILRFDRHFACYMPPAAAPAVQAPPAATRGYITFGCPARLEKINPGCARCWAALLNAVPTSRLLLMNIPANDAESLAAARELLFACGIDASRVDFGCRLPFEDYLAAHHHMDIMLETWPANGHTTSCHALWMGVPVITIGGDRFISRLGASLLSCLDMQEFIAETPEHYISIAAKLAGDIPRLIELRTTMRDRMMRSSLVDHKGFTRSLERSLQEMWNYSHNISA